MKVDLKALIGDLSKPDGPDNYRARVRLRNETARVGGKGQEAERKELAAALAKAVVETQPKDRRSVPQLPRTNTSMRGELLRSLCEIATAAEVPVLMKAIDDSEGGPPAVTKDGREVLRRRNAAMDDSEISDFVRRAIECIPGEEATAALAQMAVKEAGTEFRIGAINALGKRKTPAAFEALKTCAADPDPRVRLAAAEALSNFGDPSVQPMVMQALDPRQGPLPHGNAARTQLRLAANVAKAGNKPAANMMFRSIGGLQPERFQMKAAEIGVQTPPPSRR